MAFFAYGEIDMSMNDVPGAQMRIIRLEENSCFQEKKLEELDQELREMQKQLRSITAKTEALQNAILQMREDFHAQYGKTPDPLPPHYQIDK